MRRIHCPCPSRRRPGGNASSNGRTDSQWSKSIGTPILHRLHTIGASVYLTDKGLAYRWYTVPSLHTISGQLPVYRSPLLCTASPRDSSGSPSKVSAVGSFLAAGSTGSMLHVPVIFELTREFWCHWAAAGGSNSPFNPRCLPTRPTDRAVDRPVSPASRKLGPPPRTPRSSLLSYRSGRSPEGPAAGAVYARLGVFELRVCPNTLAASTGASRASRVSPS